MKSIVMRLLELDVAIRLPTPRVTWHTAAWGCCSTLLGCSAPAGSARRCWLQRQGRQSQGRTQSRVPHNRCAQGWGSGGRCMGCTLTRLVQQTLCRPRRNGTARCWAAPCQTIRADMPHIASGSCRRSRPGTPGQAPHSARQSTHPCMHMCRCCMCRAARNPSQRTGLHLPIGSADAISDAEVSRQ